jgi:hypothetical protein
MEGLKMIKGVVKGSTLCWNIGSSVISYNQLKKLI